MKVPTAVANETWLVPGVNPSSKSSVVCFMLPRELMNDVSNVLAVFQSIVGPETLTVIFAAAGAAAMIEPSAAIIAVGTNLFMENVPPYP